MKKGNSSVVAIVAIIVIVVLVFFAFAYYNNFFELRDINVNVQEGDRIIEKETIREKETTEKEIVVPVPVPSNSTYP